MNTQLLNQVLPLTDESSLGLDSVGRIPYLRGNVTENTYNPYRKRKSLSMHESLCSGGHLLGAQLITSILPKYAQL